MQLPSRGFISISKVSKSYRTSAGKEVQAIKEVSLEVGKGQVVSVIGRSGCGKSTLLKMVAGLVKPSSGTIAVEGSQVDSPLGGVGFVPQAPLLMPWRRALDNVLLPVELMKLDRESYLERGVALLRASGLEGFEKAYPRELSIGMQQRVSIARALIHDPPIFLMDEPFGALDELTREEMTASLLKVVEGMGKTVMFVTHSIPEAVLIGDRVVVMSPRPSSVRLDVKVDLPRPRSQSLLTDPRYVRYCDTIRSSLRERERSVEEGGGRASA